MKEENDKSKKLQTVERALDVLYLFHKYNGITLSFVAEKMNMSTTVAYRLLYTLADSGFLRQEKASKKYYLGEKSLLLGYSAIRSQELEKTAYPIMKRLMDKCGLSVILTSLTDMQSLCVEKIEAEDDLQLSMRVGGIYLFIKELPTVRCWRIWSSGTVKADCHMDGIILKPDLYLDDQLIIKAGEFQI